MKSWVCIRLFSCQNRQVDNYAHFMQWLARSAEVDRVWTSLSSCLFILHTTTSVAFHSNNDNWVQDHKCVWGETIWTCVFFCWIETREAERCSQKEAFYTTFVWTFTIGRNSVNTSEVSGSTREDMNWCSNSFWTKHSFLSRSSVILLNELTETRGIRRENWNEISRNLNTETLKHSLHMQSVLELTHL